MPTHELAMTAMTLINVVCPRGDASPALLYYCLARNMLASHSEYTCAASLLASMCHLHSYNIDKIENKKSGIVGKREYTGELNVLAEIPHLHSKNIDTLEKRKSRIVGSREYTDDSNVIAETHHLHSKKYWQDRKQEI